MKTKTMTRPPLRMMSDLLVDKVGNLKRRPALTAKLRASTAIPNVTYSAPIEITKGGVYKSLNIRSTDPNTPCITVSTYDPVEITGCILVNCGRGSIWCNGGSKVNVHHNSIYGDTPAGGTQYGKAFYSYHPQTVIFKNNTCEHTGGILIDHYDENTKSVYIGYNIIRNTDKRRADLSLGDQHAAAIQFNTVPGITGVIEWNFIENLPGESRVEDNINIYNSGGTAATPFLIHDNYIKGAYSWPLTADFTGSGITVDGDPSTNTFATVSQYINAYNNQVISTFNAAMNIAAGHDVHFYNNTMISSGLLPDGTKSNRYWSGACIWDASRVGSSVFTNNDIKGNTIGFVSWGQNVNGTDRQDTGTVAGEKINIAASDNTHIPGVITLAMEEAELVKWKERTKGMAIGNMVGSDAPPVVVVTPGSVTVKVGETITRNIVTKNSAGVECPFNSPVVSSTAPVKVAVNGKQYTITGVTKGAATVTVTVTSVSGKVWTKTLNVEVTDDANEIASMEI